MSIEGVIDAYVLLSGSPSATTLTVIVESGADIETAREDLEGRFGDVGWSLEILHGPAPSGEGYFQ